MHATTWAEHARLNPLRREGLLGRVGPSVAVGIVVFAVVPATDPERPGLAIAAAALTLLFIIVALLLPWERWRPGVAIAVPLAFVFLIALLRSSGPGPALTFDSLFALPLLWTALYGRTREVAVVLVASAAALSYAGTGNAPGTDIAVEQWPELIVLIAVGGLIGWSVRTLVRELHRREHILGPLASMSKRLGEGDTRRIVSDELMQASGACFAGLYEPDVAGALACTSGATAGSAAPAPARRAAEDLEPVFERRQSPDEWPGLPQTVQAVLCMPVEDGEMMRGVIVVGWERAPGLSEVLVNGVRLTADQLAAALAREERISKLDELARVDGLTGIANRREWDSRLPRELNRARRTGDPITVGMADLDHFKPFNDSRGHQAGDDVLREMARRWSRHVRDTDVLARYGGEEFALAFADCDLDSAVERAEELRRVIPERQACSVGLALWDRHESAHDLVARADRALYAAKRAGRDRVVVDVAQTAPRATAVA